MLRFVLFLILAIAAYQPASAAVVRVANGDCAGLSTAVTTAAQGAGTTTILLARNGNYSGCGINVSAGNVVIDGQGSQMQFFSACIIGADQVPAPGAALLLRNLSIGALAASQANPPECRIETGALGLPYFSYGIVNTGSLTLESVTLQTLVTPSTDYYIAFIASFGSVVLHNVSVVNAQLPLIQNSGQLEIYNSTFVNDGQSSFNRTLIEAAAFGGSQGVGQIANSLFAGFASPVCATYGSVGSAALKSLGGNVASEGSCGFSSATNDVITQSPGLGSFGNNGGLVPTPALAYGSAAHGVSVAQYCEALDARGYTRAANTCDAGAYEYGGGSGALTANGMNGVYYDPAANGHYVSIQRIHDNGDVLVIWNTFDQKGNPAWIYGVGQITDKHIHAAMSQNLGGVLQVGGPAIGSTVRAWGSVDIDLTSCLLAQFNYQSSLPEFGSGQFPLTRLAIVTDFGCSD